VRHRLYAASSNRRYGRHYDVTARMTSHSSAHAWRRLRRWENQRMLSSFPNINRTQGPRGPHPQGLLPKNAAPCRFLSLVSLTFDLRPPNSNSVEIFVQCTQPLSFIILRSIVRKLSCWQINEVTDKQTNWQTDAAENTHLAPLCYAGGYWNTENDDRQNRWKFLSAFNLLYSCRARLCTLDLFCVN